MHGGVHHMDALDADIDVGAGMDQLLDIKLVLEKPSEHQRDRVQLKRPPVSNIDAVTGGHLPPGHAT
jgi:hypothetical protein